MMPQVPIIKGDKVDGNVDYRDALPVNMYAIPREVLGAKGYMINFFGLSSFATGVGIDRGGVWVSRSTIEGHYRVSGQKLIEVSASGTVTELGDVPGTDQASFAFSFNNVAIVADGDLFYYNRTAGFRRITDPQVKDPDDVEWVDGYFFLTDGETIYHSNIANEELFEPLAFGNSEFLPDSSRGLSKTEDNEIIVWSEFSNEPFINIGSENFAFQRISRKAQKLGILGTHCKTELEGDFYVLGRRENTNPSFHIVSLGEITTISTRETDKIIAEYADDELSVVTIDSFIEDNQDFIVYHLPRHTLLFNKTMSEAGAGLTWTILKSDIDGDEPFRAKNYIRDPRNGKWICGDIRGGAIGELNKSIATHYGDIAEWILFTPFFKYETLSINEIEIETIPGITIDDDATVFLSFTSNGRTYGMERSVSYGGKSDYDKRFIVNRPYGMIRDWLGIKLRGASRSRMAFALLNLEVS